ncbi:hypothetical protein LTR36_006711 [Oleoguttula mirabilis]|uniref:SGNH hydrolase-type esterase domain-containing protein n=1 Tax=Oleoguttula mirabilis TaxID=1507867 RepID=A0AAV9JBB0_9PEZI|nr:hypothetical protein LTR36_006711 [Oleoguttula mirabilis]
MARLKITALGSSFAAGPSIDPIIDTPAGRSGRNYSHQLALELGATLTDLTVSGATLLNVLHEPQAPVFGKGDVFPPQLEGLQPDTDIVTLTAGGNDLLYSFGMLQESLASYAPGPLWYLLQMLQRWMTARLAVEALDLQQLTDRFIAVLDAVHARAPAAKVYLVQYLSVFGEDSRPGPGIPLTWQQIGYHRRRAVVLDRAYEAAAAARSNFTELVPAAELSQGHEVGTAEPWMLGFRLGMLWKGVAPYHPNVAGHTAVAEELCRRIRAAGKMEA